MTTMNEKFYSAFGILTVAFASMEAKLRSLISGIAFGGDSVVSSAFLDSSQLGGNLNVLRKLSKKYWDKEELFLDIIKSTESIRSTRNLFIHGIWIPRTFGEPNGYATVTDLKTKYEKDEKTRSWTHGQTSEYNITDFQDILDNVNSIKEKIENLCKLFEIEDNDIHFGMEGKTISTEPIQISLPFTIGSNN